MDKILERNFFPRSIVPHGPQQLPVQKESQHVFHIVIPVLLFLSLFQEFQFKNRSVLGPNAWLFEVQGAQETNQRGIVTAVDDQRRLLVSLFHGADEGLSKPSHGNIG